MAISELYCLSLFRAGHSCKDCAYNTTCKIEEKSENRICKNYMYDGFVKAMKLTDEENKNEN